MLKSFASLRDKSLSGLGDIICNSSNLYDRILHVQKLKNDKVVEV
jgi:hypothetical protein